MTRVPRRAILSAFPLFAAAVPTLPESPAAQSSHVRSPAPRHAPAPPQDPSQKPSQAASARPSPERSEAIRRPISPTDGAYSEAMELTRFRRLVFVSGQVPVDAEDRVPTTFREQARVAWKNVAAQLAKADMTVKDIVKMTIFLSDRQYRGEAYETRREALGEHCPAMTIIICGIYRENWLLEIEVVAAD